MTGVERIMAAVIDTPDKSGQSRIYRQAVQSMLALRVYK